MFFKYLSPLVTAARRQREEPSFSHSFIHSFIAFLSEICLCLHRQGGGLLLQSFSFPDAGHPDTTGAHLRGLLQPIQGRRGPRVLQVRTLSQFFQIMTPIYGFWRNWLVEVICRWRHPDNRIIISPRINLSYCHSVMESDLIVYARGDDYFCNLSLYQDRELWQNVITPSSPRASGK